MTAPAISAFDAACERGRQWYARGVADAREGRTEAQRIAASVSVPTAHDLASYRLGRFHVAEGIVR